MALPTFNTKSPTIKRILKEAAELQAQPDPTLHAAPLESNLFEWHFTLQGPPSTPYSAGAYHGRIVLPPTYPLRPPSFRFLTPSGRFEPNREICLSISGHHEETWQPAWGIRTALWALRAFMEGDAKGQVGGMEMPESERKRLAEESKSWRCQGCGGRTNETILREQGGESSEESSTAAVVPEELKFGFKEQIGLEENKGKGKENVQDDVPSTLKEKTCESSSLDRNPEPAPSTAEDNCEAPPTHAAPSAAATLRPQPTPTRPTLAPQSNGPPPWVDKAITGVAAALAVMIIKKVALS